MDRNLTNRKVLAGFYFSLHLVLLALLYKVISIRSKLDLTSIGLFFIIFSLYGLILRELEAISNDRWVDDDDK